MRLVYLTLPTPAENLALDEALLSEGEETLRLWETPTPMVVLGRASPSQSEVDQQACRRHGAAVLRRISGGATVVALPGCLMYAVVLNTAKRPEARAIDAAHRYVLGNLVDALRPFEPTVRIAGTSDLAVQRQGRLLKVSGNSLRVTRDRLLYHGTLLYAADLPLVAELLGTPERQPDYRERRPHGEFVANLHATAPQLAESLTRVWGAAEESAPRALERVEGLCAQKYALASWNLAR
ncbi:putative lipoate-protein ligase A [Pirellulimonas nuda]|uniref:Putative lipoate-protein ligase A n=1 Tax=Pirellulimonas nuda TaxID=2528009 RepID=A0A518D6Y1_9BACT|nr:lipoate--protein ligase family protein [Pirellulimonas nuda]QDU87215.1 putative lipoate-protein ligase A [Pirellulimonas nuda]